MKTLRIGMTVGLSALTVAAFALPSMVADLTKAYKVPAKTALAKASCAACHQGMDTQKFNPYGQDLKKVMDAAKTKKLTPALLKKVETRDSDKDGVKNLAELKKGTLPGDPKSK